MSSYVTQITGIVLNLENNTYSPTGLTNPKMSQAGFCSRFSFLLFPWPAVFPLAIFLPKSCLFFFSLGFSSHVNVSGWVASQHPAHNDIFLSSLTILFASYSLYFSSWHRLPPDMLYMYWLIDLLSLPTRVQLLFFAEFQESITMPDPL